MQRKKQIIRLYHPSVTNKRVDSALQTVDTVEKVPRGIQDSELDRKALC